MLAQISKGKWKSIMANNKIFYIADMHFHDNTVFKWDVRNNPDIERFADLDAKNAAMIDRWNEVVTNRDHVYILGDAFSCSKENAMAILKQLHGAKHFCMGNHDRAWLRDIAASKKFNVVECFDTKMISDNGRKVFLSHYPVAFWDDQHRGSFMLYGHVHQSREYDEFVAFGQHLVEAGHLPEFRAFNVGTMLHGYAPVTLQQLISENGVGKMTKAEFKEANRRDWMDT